MDRYTCTEQQWDLIRYLLENGSEDKVEIDRRIEEIKAGLFPERRVER